MTALEFITGHRSLINSNWKPPWFDFGFENLARWSKDAINWPYGKAKNHKELLNTAHMCVFFVKSFLNSFQEVESTWNDHWHQSTPKIGFCKWKEFFLTFPACFSIPIIFPILILIVLIYQVWETSRNKLKKHSVTKNCSDLSLFK